MLRFFEVSSVTGFSVVSIDIGEWCWNKHTTKEIKDEDSGMFRNMSVLIAKRQNEHQTIDQKNGTV